MTPLGEKIAQHIQREGPISFRHFMDMALYDPQWGYYSRCREIGARGDYYTAANVHPLFGECLANQFLSLLGELGPTPEVTIVEVGAGTGRLAADVLGGLRRMAPELAGRIEYVIAERSPALRQVQRENLKPFSRVTWQSLDEREAASVRGIIFSNELVDALPVHRLIRQGKRIRELLVDWRDGQFHWTVGELTDPRLREVLARWEAPLRDGQIIEVNLEACEYLQRAATLLEEGYVVTIDYGDIRARLYTPERDRGTLRCFYRHLVHDDPFVRVGEQDITTSVDFTLLMEWGERVGLSVIRFMTQREFLMNQGILERLAQMVGQERGVAGLASMLSAKHLLMPGAWGDHFKLLIQRKSCG